MRSWVLALVVGGLGCRFGYDEQPAGPGTGAVQSGSAILADGLSETSVTVDPLELDRAMLVFSLAADSQDPDDVQISGEIESPTSLRFRRSGTETEVELSWYVVTLPAGQVQRGVALLNSPTAQVSFAAVDLASSFPLFSVFADGNDFSSDDLVRGDLVGDSTLAFDINDADVTDTSIAWQVVSLEGAVVTSDTSVIARTEAELSVVLADAAAADSFLIYSHDTEDSGVANIANLLLRGQLADSGASINFDRGDSGTAIEVTSYVVTAPAGWTVRRGSASLEGGERTASISFSAVEVSKSFAFFGLMGHGGRTAQTSGDSPGNAWATISLDSGTSATISRASATARAQFAWFVVELP